MLRERFLATRMDASLAGWADVRLRAQAARTQRRRRRRITAALVLAGAVILVLPTPGIGNRLFDVVAGRDARPAIRQELDSIPATPDVARVFGDQARELVDAQTARGPLTLVEAPDSNGTVCVGVWATWLQDDGTSCGASAPTPDQRFGVSFYGRYDAHVIAIAGFAPAAARAVRLDVGSATSQSPVVGGMFLVAFDPTLFAAEPSAKVTAVDAQGNALGSEQVNLDSYYDIRCDRYAPSVVIASISTASATVALREAHNLHQRCAWVESGGEISLGPVGPLTDPPFDPAKDPAIIPQAATFPDGASVLWGRAYVPATRAVIFLANGTSTDVALADRYLLTPLAPQTNPGERPVAIDLFGADGTRLASVTVDPDHIQH
jgi:hypothetical protein